MRRFSILILLLTTPVLSFATEVVTLEANINFMLCDQSGQCKIENSATEKVKAELADNGITTQYLIAETRGFSVRVAIDFSKNIIKRYGFRFSYDFCMDKPQNSATCQSGPYLGYILTENLLNFKDNSFGFTGQTHLYDGFLYRPQISIQNITLEE